MSDSGRRSVHGSDHDHGGVHVHVHVDDHGGDHDQVNDHDHADASSTVRHVDPSTVGHVDAPSIVLRLALVSAVVCAGACGRVAFDPRADAAGVADGADAPRSCWSRWHTGDVTFSDVRRLDELTGSSPVDPSLSPDGSELFYVADNDFYVATRAGAAWSVMRRIDELSTASVEARLTLATDGSAVFASDRASTSPELWETRRDASSRMFSPPTQASLTAVNAVGAEGNPELDPTGTELYFTRTLQIWRTTRPVGGVYATPAVVTDLDPVDRAVDVSLAPDGLVAVFAASSTAILDLWFATRATTSVAFGPATQLTSLATAQDDADPELSPDGCELYFSRALGEIWVATVAP